MKEERRIEVTVGGPYRVYGAVPLKEMAPVHTFNGEPVDWHTLREVPIPGDTYDLCRCGRSKNKPFCDCSHESPEFDGKETASRQPYRERGASWRNGEDRLHDVLPLCIKAGFCRTRTLDAWGLFQNASEPAQREQMRDMVWNCPSGRLALYAADGFPNEPDLPQEIGVLPGGPLWVRGGIPIVGEDGQPWEPRNRATVCRCGGSRNKPFCDASHLELHFDER